MPYFTQETLDFLAGIRANNSKEWFEPRKAFYQEHVLPRSRRLGMHCSSRIRTCLK